MAIMLVLITCSMRSLNDGNGGSASPINSAQMLTPDQRKKCLLAQTIYDCQPILGNFLLMLQMQLPLRVLNTYMHAALCQSTCWSTQSSAALQCSIIMCTNQGTLLVVALASSSCAQLCAAAGALSKEYEWRS